MKPGRILLYSFLLTVPIWLLFSWPLAKHVTTGIPSSADCTEKDGVRYMIQGDHLQLLYHFWLAQDMLSGKTRMFHNLYEFNEGDDTGCYAPGTYYAPFSLVFAAISLPFGRAVAWNITGFLSLWLTLFFTWLLARRYADMEIFAMAAATASILLPCRWVNLLGGSPAGLAMLWVPPLLLGLDLAVRADSFKGGLLAGVALLFACSSDLHVFYFSMLIVPAWCVVAFVRRDIFQWRNGRHYLALAIALAPAAALGFIGFVYRALRSRRLADAVMADGRDLSEVAINSPAWQGLWSFGELGHTNQIFIGYAITGLIAAGLFFAFATVFERKQEFGWRRRFVFLCVCIGILGIISLALGTHGPFDGKPLLICRKFLPKYVMIRQPAKIYALLPPLLAVGLAMALSSIRCATSRRNRTVITGFALAVCFCAVAECKVHVHATVSLLATDQPAYAAVAGDPGNEGRPHALVIPLWPGDSAWSSLYEHYASLYRIRTINGYSPVVKKSYKANVFDRFGSCNKGMLTDGQVDALREMGIGYVILHEDAFPEKVSALPVGFTLKRLLNHPQLELVRQSGPVWAFRILAEPRTPVPAADDWTVFFPARRHEFERAPGNCTVTKATEDVSGAGFISLSEPGHSVVTAGTHMAPATGLCWLVRAGGSGMLKVGHEFDGEIGAERELRIDSAGWNWLVIPVEGLDRYAKTALRFTFVAGAQIDLDAAMLMAGEWKMPAPGESLTLPAALFFHAGATDPATGSVLFLPLRDHAAFAGQDLAAVSQRDGDTGSVFYGPRLPLPAGDYRVELVFDSRAPDHTMLGSFHLRQNRQVICFEYIHAGATAWADINVPYELPVNLSFLYSGEGDIAIRNITFSRVMRENGRSGRSE